MTGTRNVFLAACLLILAPSCATAAPASTEARPAVTEGTASASPTPPPEIGLELKDFSFQQVAGGTLFLGTLQNMQADDLADLELGLAFIGPDGSRVASRTLRPIPDSLPSEGLAGLWTLLDPQNAPLDPEIRLVASSHDSGVEPNLRVRVIDTRPSASGQLLILGEIINRGDEYLRFNDMVLLPGSIGEGPQGVARPILVPLGLPPGDSLPFAAEILGEAPDDGWQVFIDASPSGIPDTPPVVIQSGPTLQQSSQGRPFYTLQLRNTGSLPRWVAGVMAFYQGDTLMALSRLSEPVPIRPGETRPVSVGEFTGLQPEADLSPPRMEGWRVELRIDALASRPELDEVRTLEVAVTQFEVIGGLIFLRGELANPHSVDVEHPAVLITARDVGGRLLNSAWATPGEELASGSSVGFELTMLLPVGVTAESSEFDLQGVGLAPR